MKKVLFYSFVVLALLLAVSGSVFAFLSDGG